MSDTELTNMDEILAVSELPLEEPTEPEPKAETPEEPEQPETKADAPEKPEDKSTDQMVPHQALHEEREKRKQERERYDKLVGQITPLLDRLAPEKPKDETPQVSFSEDPEGYVVAKLTAIEEVATRTAQTRFFDLSEASAKRRYEDFDEALEDFKTLAKKEPALIQKLNQQPDPAEWAYRTAKQAKGIAEIGDPAAFREKLEKELREKWEAEQAAQESEQVEETETPSRPSPPKTLAKARSSGGRNASKQFTGPTPIDQILPGG